MLWMMLAGAMFIVLNTMMKRLAGELDPWLVGLLRYAIGAAVIATAAMRLGPRTLWPRAPRLQFVRGVFHAGGMILWFAALPKVSLTALTAIAFSGPIFICLGAVLFLRERMTGARWAAVLVGFGGVLLVLNPGAGAGFAGVSAGMLRMLASPPAFAGAYLVAKAIKKSTTLAFADLGMEAIYEFEVEDMPVTVAVDSKGTSVHQTGPREWQQRIAELQVLG